MLLSSITIFQMIHLCYAYFKKIDMSLANGYIEAGKLDHGVGVYVGAFRSLEYNQPSYMCLRW